MVSVAVIVAMPVVMAARCPGRRRMAVVVIVMVVAVVIMMIVAVVIMVVMIVVVVLAHASVPVEGSAICSSISLRTPLMWASAAE